MSQPKKKKNLARMNFKNFKGEIAKELANLPELLYLYLPETLHFGKIPLESGIYKIVWAIKPQVSNVQRK